MAKALMSRTVKLDEDRSVALIDLDDGSFGVEFSRVDGTVQGVTRCRMSREAAEALKALLTDPDAGEKHITPSGKIHALAGAVDMVLHWRAVEMPKPEPQP